MIQEYWWRVKVILESGKEIEAGSRFLTKNKALKFAEGYVNNSFSSKVVRCVVYRILPFHDF